MYGKIRKGFIMKARIVIAVLLLLGLAGAVAAQNGVCRRCHVIMVESAILTASELADIEAGKSWRGTLKVTTHFPGSRKDLISWTAGKRWLNLKHANPAHGRRGNVYASRIYGHDTNSHGTFVARIPAGNTLRVRARPVLEDGSLGQACVAKVTLDKLIYSVPFDGWRIDGFKSCDIPW